MGLQTVTRDTNHAYYWVQLVSSPRAKGADMSLRKGTSVEWNTPQGPTARQNRGEKDQRF